jgi:hypothetical protein
MRTVTAMVAALSLGACAAQPSPFADMAAQIRGDSGADANQGIVYDHPPRFNTPGPAAPPKLASVHETIAVAAGVPTLNFEASCHLAANLAFDQNVNRCLADESKARDQLAHKWAEFPSADRLHCVRYSSAGGAGTYTDLLTCLELELNVRSLHEKNRSVANQ